MKITINILVIMMILIITACSKREDITHNYIYRGENEFWSAEYKVNGTSTFFEKNGTLEYESNASKVFIVTYKKELSQLASTKHLEISYKSSAGAGKITEDYTDGPPNKKTYTMKSGVRGGVIENKDQVIEVTINLDGKTEIIELKNVN